MVLSKVPGYLSKQHCKALSASKHPLLHRGIQVTLIWLGPLSICHQFCKPTASPPCTHTHLVTIIFLPKYTSESKAKFLGLGLIYLFFLSSLHFSCLYPIKLGCSTSGYALSGVANATEEISSIQPICFALKDTHNKPMAVNVNSDGSPLWLQWQFSCVQPLQAQSFSYIQTQRKSW